LYRTAVGRGTAPPTSPWRPPIFSGSIQQYSTVPMLNSCFGLGHTVFRLKSRAPCKPLCMRLPLGAAPARASATSVVGAVGAIRPRCSSRAERSPCSSRSSSTLPPTVSSTLPAGFNAWRGHSSSHPPACAEPLEIFDLFNKTCTGT